MLNPKVAARYAKSIKSLAKEQGLLEEVHADMQLIAGLCNEARDFRKMLESPVVNTDKKLSILKEVFTGKVTELTMQFMEIIARKRREALLASIAEAFVLLYNHHNEIHEATVTTAVALDDELRAAFKDAIASAQKGSVQLKEKVDPDLLGGFVLRVGDNQFNASIRQKLNELEKEFSKNTYQRKI